MRWQRGVVWWRQRVGTDDLGNPVMRLVESEATILVRPLPMSPHHVDAEGNAFHAIDRTFITKAAPSLLEGAEAVEVGGILWEIVGRSRGDAMIALNVRRCKTCPSG